MSLTVKFTRAGTVFGFLASIVPVVILPYYCSIGGWVLKYLSVFLTGHGTAAAEDGYFTGYITGTWQPIVWLGIYLFLPHSLYIVVSIRELKTTAKF